MIVMHPLGPPDTHHISAAVGWLELGNTTEAAAELQRLNPALSRHPDVLEVRWLIHAQEHDWDRGLAVALLLLEQDPDRASAWLHRAYALRRAAAGGLQQAWDVLLPAFEKFPEESTIPYNLACYACQLGRLAEARQWLQRALNQGDKQKIKSMALHDDDLKPLWDEIREL